MEDTQHNLAKLIREHQDRTGDSYQDIARKTGLSKAKIGQLARPENRYMVRIETLKKLAHGLGIPLGTVERAAVGTVGLGDAGVEEDSTLQRVIERLKELCPEDLELVADLIEAAAKHPRG